MVLIKKLCVTCLFSRLNILLNAILHHIFTNTVLYKYWNYSQPSDVGDIAIFIVKKKHFLKVAVRLLFDAAK